MKTPGVKAAVVKQRLTVGSGTRDLESPRNTNQLSISSLFSVCTVCSFPRQACAEGFFTLTENETSIRILFLTQASKLLYLWKKSMLSFGVFFAIF